MGVRPLRSRRRCQTKRVRGYDHQIRKENKFKQDEGGFIFTRNETHRKSLTLRP